MNDLLPSLLRRGWTPSLDVAYIIAHHEISVLLGSIPFYILGLEMVGLQNRIALESAKPNSRTEPIEL